MSITAFDDPAEVLLHIEEVHALLCVLNDLPPRQRQAVELYYFEGLTQEQVAERMGIGRRVVGHRLEAARRNMSTILVEGGPFYPSNGITSRGTNIEYLMRSPARKIKRHHAMIFPYELWQRYAVGAGWAANHIYATRYRNRLREYLRDSFGHDGVAVPRM